MKDFLKNDRIRLHNILFDLTIQMINDGAQINDSDDNELDDDQIEQLINEPYIHNFNNVKCIYITDELDVVINYEDFEITIGRLSDKLFELMNIQSLLDYNEYIQNHLEN